MSTILTPGIKRKLLVDIEFIDSQLELAADSFRDGDLAECQNILDSLSGYYDLKDDFPDIMVNENLSIKFRHVYEAMREIDELFRNDGSASGFEYDSDGHYWFNVKPWEEIVRRLRALQIKLQGWIDLNWDFGDKIKTRLENIKKLIDLFISLRRPVGSDEPIMRPNLIEIDDAKNLLLNEMSEEFSLYHVLWSLEFMDGAILYIIFELEGMQDPDHPHEHDELDFEWTYRLIVWHKHKIRDLLKKAITVPPEEESENESGSSTEEGTENESGSSVEEESGSSSEEESEIGHFPAPLDLYDLLPNPPYGYSIVGDYLERIPTHRRGYTDTDSNNQDSTLQFSNGFLVLIFIFGIIFPIITFFDASFSLFGIPIWPLTFVSFCLLFGKVILHKLSNKKCIKG